jgi:ribosome maturation factor RimP
MLGEVEYGFFFCRLIILKGTSLKFSDYDQNELFTIIDPVCRGFSSAVVHLSTAVVKNTTHIRIVLYKKGGINIDACSEISRAVLPRIEVWADQRDVNLEVSSPGVGRILKDAFEFHVFKGEKARLLIADNWIDGTIIDADDHSVNFESGEQQIKHEYETILKAKLY